jgi:hypothetical protein
MIDELISLAESNLKSPGGSFKYVGKAYSMQALEDLQGEVPALLFIPGEDSGAESTGSNPVRQMVVRRVQAWIVADAGSIMTLSNEVRPVLLGYRPFSNRSYSRLEFESGKPFDIKGVMWYVETYRTQHQLAP